MSSDCPEHDDQICDGCLFQMRLVDRLETIEFLVVQALESKPLRKHPHRVANYHLGRALVELDELWSDIVDDDTL